LRIGTGVRNEAELLGGQVLLERGEWWHAGDLALGLEEFGGAEEVLRKRARLGGRAQVVGTGLLLGIEQLERELSSSEIFAALFELELDGKVKQLPGKNFVKSF